MKTTVTPLYPNVVAALRKALFLTTDLELAEILGVNKSVVCKARKNFTLSAASRWSLKLKEAGYNISISVIIADGKVRWSVTEV